MLTVNQPQPYGHKSVHDLPTPPSTSRPSPPLTYQEPASYKPFSITPRSYSPAPQPMSTPLRGLPPPAAMTLPPQQPPSSAPAPIPPHSQPHPMVHSHHQQVPPGSLPAPPQHWHDNDDAMKTWYQARAEEEKTKQEEEKTRQEGLRLEQRKIEMDILRQSLGGGIPPAMVPLVFAGMGNGIMPQAALDWTQQFLSSGQGQYPQLLPPQDPRSPEHRRDHSASAQYSTATTASASAHGPGYVPYPGSPSRGRSQTMAGIPGRGMGTGANVPSLNTNLQPPGASMHTYQHAPGHPAQQESSPSIYFHHWQPPSTQASSGSNRPGSPPGETSRKRKAVGSQHPTPTPAHAEPRPRSPSSFAQSSSSHMFSGPRGHRRQKSDMSWYRSPTQGHSEPSHRAASPSHAYDASMPGASRDAQYYESRKHSVSSMLSGEPRPLTQPPDSARRPYSEARRDTGHAQEMRMPDGSTTQQQQYRQYGRPSSAER